jgi:hypothetical protein
MHGGETRAWCRTSVSSERREVLHAMLVQDEQLHGDILAEQPPQDMPKPPRVPAPPIISRFLFAHVCGLRARQLRKGARARVETWSQMNTVRRRRSEPQWKRCAEG